jgi:hypothetical protein
MPGTSEWNRQLLDASVKLDEAHEQLDTRVRNAAESNRKWRLARAEAYVRMKGKPGTVPEKQSLIEMETATEQYEAELNEGLHRAASEAVKSRRQQLSAVQSLVSLAKSEADLAKWGPSEGNAA